MPFGSSKIWTEVNTTISQPVHEQTYRRKTKGTKGLFLDLIVSSKSQQGGH